MVSLNLLARRYLPVQVANNEMHEDNPAKQALRELNGRASLDCYSIFETLLGSFLVSPRMKPA
jgi:hypothetical protein